MSRVLGQVVQLEDVPFWTIIPFIAVVATATWQAVRWILSHPEPE